MLKILSNSLRNCKKTLKNKLLCIKGSKDERVFLEKRYGKAKLQQLMDNVASEDYLSENARVSNRQYPLKQGNVKPRPQFFFRLIQ